MSTETIEINGQKHEIEVKPITILCQQGDMRVKYNDRIELSDIDTTYHIEKCMKLHTRTMEFFHIVFPDILRGYESEERNGETWVVSKTEKERRFHDLIKSEGGGVKHVFGLVDLTLKFADMGVQVAWLHPESHLHPSAQVNLADLALAFTEEFKTDEEKQAKRISKIKQDIGYKK